MTTIVAMVQQCTKQRKIAFQVARIFALFTLCVSFHTAYADSTLTYNHCITQAAQQYQINTGLVRAIIQVESAFDPKAININTSGSEDVGLMQINSEWLPRIKRFGIDREKLFHPCTNISVGVWILAQEIARFGNTWEAVGAYNAGPAPEKKKRRLRYAQKVRAALSP